MELTEPTATRNAERLISLEESLRIDIESAVQDVVLDSAWLTDLGNWSYVWLHWPLIVLVLALLAVRDAGRYRILRNALFLSGIVGLFCFWLYPMAPPRFMPGFVGTVSDAARTHHLEYPLSWANRYAAFPSFHVGWTIICCTTLAETIRGADRHQMLTRLLILIPAVLVSLSVVSTGNHYLIDAVAGGLIAIGAKRWAVRSA